MELIRYALVRAQKPIGTDLHINFPDPSDNTAWYQRPFDQDDLISIIAFQKASQTYKDNKFDKNHTST